MNKYLTNLFMPTTLRKANFLQKYSMKATNVKIFSKLQKSHFLDKIQRGVSNNELFQENPGAKS